MRKQRRGGGSVFRMKKSRFWWISYSADSKRRFESSQSERKAEAVKLLNSRLGDIEKGLVVNPKIGKITVREALQAVVNDMTMNGKRSVAHTRRRIAKHLLRTIGTETGYFHPDRRMSTITTADLSAYVTHRLAQKASRASCNLELAIIRRAFRLAIRGGTLVSMPHVPMLQVSNTRVGFFEESEFAAVREALPEHLRGVATFAYFTGWRRSEILTLQWCNVDRARQVITLAVGTTKNNAGRTLPYGLLPELVDVIDTAWAGHEHLVQSNTLCPFVFHRNGKEIRDFRTVWEAACVTAKCPDKIVHDFRRTAARNLIRAGVPEKQAMAVTGHKTRSVFDRYDIIVEDDVRNALGALAAVKPPRTPRTGQVQRFTTRKTG